MAGSPATNRLPYPTPSPGRSPFTATTRLVSDITGWSGMVDASGGGTMPYSSRCPPDAPVASMAAMSHALDVRSSRSDGAMVIAITTATINVDTQDAFCILATRATPLAATTVSGTRPGSRNRSVSQWSNGSTTPAAETIPPPQSSRTICEPHQTFSSRRHSLRKNRPQLPEFRSTRSVVPGGGRESFAAS